MLACWLSPPRAPCRVPAKSAIFAILSRPSRCDAHDYYYYYYYRHCCYYYYYHYLLLLLRRRCDRSARPPPESAARAAARARRFDPRRLIVTM